MPLWYGFNRLPDEHAVHDDRISGGQITNRKFVLGWDRRSQQIGIEAKMKQLTLGQILQCDQDIVTGIQLQNFRVHFKSIVAR